MSNHNIIRASDWVSISDIARRAGVSRQAIHQAIERGSLRAIKFGPRTKLVNRLDAERYLTTRERKAG